MVVLKKKTPISGGGVVRPVVTTPNKLTPSPVTTNPIKPPSTNYSLGSNPPKQGYGIGYGAVKPGQKSVGYTDKNAEIDRTNQVIKNRQAQGLDTASQFAHYKNLTGNEYGTSPSPSTPAPAVPGFDMGQFTSMFEGYNSQNDSRFSALEKMIQEMANANKYNSAQQGQAPAGGQQAVYDGTHQFTAPNQGANVGYTQNNDAMNQTLYKYLNGMWKGGF